MGLSQSWQLNETLKVEWNRCVISCLIILTVENVVGDCGKGDCASDCVTEKMTVVVNLNQLKDIV